ncbi:hypothetical protein HUJ04_002314 [Dendroctonus ponderosae]|nr:hypothetical protein HUJ04_002314 [Dendroctonus ponderosae]
MSALLPSISKCARRREFDKDVTVRQMNLQPTKLKMLYLDVEVATVARNTQVFYMLSQLQNGYRDTERDFLRKTSNLAIICTLISRLNKFQNS